MTDRWIELGTVPPLLPLSLPLWHCPKDKVRGTQLQLVDDARVVELRLLLLLLPQLLVVV